MSAVRACALQARQTVHIGPHDIFRGTEWQTHKDTKPADIRVDGVVSIETIVVIMGRIGTTLYAVVYDRNDLLEVAS